VTPIYKLSDNSILNGRIIYSSMLAGNTTFDPNSLLTTLSLLVVAVVEELLMAGGGGAGGLRSTVTATGGGGSLESALSLAFGHCLYSNCWRWWCWRQHLNRKRF
jgi:hypothetical protein